MTRALSFGYNAAAALSELVEQVTGGPISIEPYISYLRNKYGALYEL